MPNKENSIYWHYSIPDATALNLQIESGYAREKRKPDTRQSHFFAGRFENIYIDAERLPELSTLLQRVREYAGLILKVPHKNLRVGFWFNEMGPGHRTLEHSHDDDDELLSAVYYIRVPAHSGDLVLSALHEKIQVSPVAGQLLFFKPDLLHEVLENKSNETRLSIGMNVGEP